MVKNKTLINIKCAFCKKVFSISRSENLPSRKYSRKYCNQICYGKSLIGHKMDPKNYKKLILANTGRPKTEKEKLAIGKANSGKNNGMCNKIFSLEDRKRLSTIAKNAWADPDIRRKMMENPNRSDWCRKGALMAARKIKLNRFFTKPEKQMCKILSDLGYKYIHHYEMWDIEHMYMADFYLINSNTILEVDGKFWHNYPDYRPIDLLRNKELKEKGFNIIRFWDGEFDKLIVKNALLKNNITKK
jgi:very-short-patch-repair endonuclease